MVPPSTRAGGSGRSPSMVWQVTDLPDPDSPTIPTISPLSIENEMSSTALTVPERVWKKVLRFLISRNFISLWQIWDQVHHEVHLREN